MLLIRAGSLNSAKNKQTIIFRDEETGATLQQKLQSNSILYTILQSKGMEYDDVYLYNFFSSSPYPSGWRTLEALLSERGNSWYAGQNLVCFALTHFFSSGCSANTNSHLGNVLWVEGLCSTKLTINVSLIIRAELICCNYSSTE